MIPLDILKDALIKSAKESRIPDPRMKSARKACKWNPVGQILGSFLTNLRRELREVYSKKYTYINDVGGINKIQHELTYDNEVNNSIIKFLLNKENWHMPLFLKEKAMIRDIKADDWNTLKSIVGLSRVEFEKSLNTNLEDCRSSVRSMNVMLGRAHNALKSAENLVEDLEKMEKNLND